MPMFPKQAKATATVGLKIWQLLTIWQLSSQVDKLAVDPGPVLAADGATGAGPQPTPKLQPTTNPQINLCNAHFMTMHSIITSSPGFTCFAKFSTCCLIQWFGSRPASSKMKLNCVQCHGFYLDNKFKCRACAYPDVLFGPVFLWLVNDADFCLVAPTHSIANKHKKLLTYWMHVKLRCNFGIPIKHPSWWQEDLIQSGTYPGIARQRGFALVCLVPVFLLSSSHVYETIMALWQPCKCQGTQWSSESLAGS